MKSETIKNLLGSLFFLILAVATLAVAVVNFAWWHLIIAAMMGLLSYTLYVDHDYGTESVQEYFRNRKKY